MNPSIGNPVVHFEIGCKDLPGTTDFYTKIFGWTATPIPSASLLDTHSTKGIPGHITSLGHEPHQYVTVYIEVEDIPETLTRIEAAGGHKLLGPIPLPDGKKFAWFKDPGGNIMALITKA
ncbi:MAG: VOC family protein [Bacteroidetes bacterium]|nr:VOC family protein [Bacteroidota bacterium]